MTTENAECPPPGLRIRLLQVSAPVSSFREGLSDLSPPAAPTGHVPQRPAVSVPSELSLPAKDALLPEMLRFLSLSSPH